MKKYSKLFFIAIITSFVFMISSDAKTLTKDELTDYLKTMNPDASYVYVIGKYAFTSNHTLTLEDMMLAARSITTSDSGEINTDDINGAIGAMTTYHFSTVFDSNNQISSLNTEKNFTGTSEVPDKFTITYIDYNKIEEYSKVVFTVGDETYSSIVVKNGETITLPTAPTKADYVFAGWYDDNDTKLEENTVASSDVTYTAKWDKLVNTDNMVTTALESVTKEYSASYADGTVTINLTDGFTKVNNVSGTGLVTALKSLLTETSVESVTITKGDTTITINKTDDLTTIASNYETLILALADADADDYDKVVVQDLMGSEFTMTIKVKDGYETDGAGEYTVQLVGTPETTVEVSNADDFALALAHSEISTISLTTDVSVDSRLVVSEGKTVTIDLNGNTLTGPSGTDYTIENLGTLTIVNSSDDSEDASGKIVCDSSTSSCIRNLGTLTVDGVTIESAFIAIKNDAVIVEDDASTNVIQGTLTVTNSNLTSSYTPTSKSIAGTIMNYGNATVTSSIVTAPNGYAILAISGSDAGEDSVINITDTTLSGVYSVYSMRSLKTDTTTQTVNISGGVLSGKMSDGKGSEWSFDGNIEYQSNNNFVNNIIIPNAKDGATITITSETFTSPLTDIPDSVTVIVSENTALEVASNGVSTSVVIKGEVTNKNVLLSYNNTYYPTIYNAIKLGTDWEDKSDYPNYPNYTITVLNNTNETSNININYSNITIDLNGYTVTATSEGLRVGIYGIVTIKDSSESKTGKFDGTITNNGTLTLESGTYTSPVTTADGANTVIEDGVTIPTSESTSETE